MTKLTKTQSRGRGRPPVPYQTKVVRVPADLLPAVRQLIEQYKHSLADIDPHRSPQERSSFRPFEEAELSRFY